MTQTVPLSAALGAGHTGESVGYTVLNLDRTSYSAFSTTGVSESGDIAGTYYVSDGIAAPDAGGYVVVGISGTDYAEAAIEPNSVDVTAISGDTTAADRLEALLDASPGGSVVDDDDPNPSATAFETDLAEASNDHYNGAFVVFTAGALLGQSRKISDYDGTSKVLTVATAFTEAPAAGDDFIIIGRSE